MDKSTSSNSRGAQISALVASLKAGLITKAELFEKLQRLQRGERVVDLSTNQLVSPQQSPELHHDPYHKADNGSVHSQDSSQDNYHTSPSHYTDDHELQYDRVINARNVKSSSKQRQGDEINFEDFASNEQIPAPIRAMLKQMKEFTDSHLNSDDPDAQEYVQQQKTLFMAALALEAKKHGYTLPPELVQSDRVEQILSQTQGNTSRRPTTSDLNTPDTSYYYSPDRHRQQTEWSATKGGTRTRPSDDARAHRGRTLATPPPPPPPPSSSRTGGRTRYGSTTGRGGTDRWDDRSGRLGFGDWSPDTQYMSSTTASNTRITSNRDFADRAMRWREKKMEEMQRLKRLGQQKELEECTFRPKLSKTSRNLVRTGRRGDPSTIHERLYERSKTRKVPMKSGGSGGDTSGEDENTPYHPRDKAGNNTSTPEYTQFGTTLHEASELVSASATPPPVPSNRGKTRGRSLGRARASVSNTRSHKDHSDDDDYDDDGDGGHVSRSSTRKGRTIDARNVASRYRETTESRRAKSRAASHEMEYTFKPSVNKVCPEKMPAAAIYTSAPIYERLANTTTRAQMERQRAIQERKEKLEQTKIEEEERRGLSLERSTYSARSSRRTSTEPDERMADFFARQNAAQERKKRNLELIKKATEPPHAPRLCEMSLQIVERRFGSTGESSVENFLRRRKEQLLMKEHENHKRKTRMLRDAECTFAPRINPVSKKLAPRSVTELSQGDALRRETARRMLKLKHETQDMTGFNFQPRINARSRMLSEGRLRISQDPHDYIARVQAENDLQAERAYLIAKEREERELAECTFHPKVSDAPEYVKRIAHSMAMTRALREPEPVPARPEWR